MTTFSLSLLVFVLVSAGLQAGRKARVDDDRDTSIEAEILKTLADNGTITRSQYHDLLAKAAALRLKRNAEYIDLDREILILKKQLELRTQDIDSRKAPDTATVSYKDGFYFTSTDGNFQLHPLLYFRQRFTYVDIGATPGLANEDTASFEIRNARLWLDGFVGSPDLTYLCSVEFASSGPILRDCWLDYKIDDALHIRGGQQKQPVDYQDMCYSAKNSFVDRPSTVAFFEPNVGLDSTDPGVSAWGRPFDHTFEWRLGLFNGDGPNNGAPGGTSIGPGGGVFLSSSANNNDSTGLATAARIQWTPFGEMDRYYFTNGYAEGDYERLESPRLAIGTHFIFNPERNNGATPPVKAPQDIQTWGADVAFKYEGFFALAEVFARHITGRPSPLPSTTDVGYFGQLQYFFGSDTPRRGFEAVARWSVVDVDAATLGLVPIGDTTEIHDATVGLNYLFNGHRLKLQSAYTYRDQISRATDNVTDHIFQLQLQFLF